MPTTTNGLPYPSSTAPPNVPADIQALAEAVDTAVLAAKPHGEFRKQIDVQSIPNAAALPTVILLTALGTLEGGITVNGAGEITVPRDGIYLMAGWLAFVQSNTTPYRAGYIQVGGTAIIRATAVPTANTFAHCTMTATRRLTAGTKVTLAAYQTSGAALNVEFANNQTGLDVTWLRP